MFYVGSSTESFLMELSGLLRLHKMKPSAKKSPAETEVIGTR